MDDKPIAIQDGSEHYVPNRRETESAMCVDRSLHKYQASFFVTLRLLLLAGFCLLLTVTARGQSFTVEVIQPVQSFTVVVTEPDEPEFYIYTFTADYCSLCQSDKRSGKHDQIKKRWPYSVVIDVVADVQWTQARDAKVNKLPRVERLPTVWLMKRGDARHVLKSWQGSTSIETIETEITRIHETKSGTITTTRTVSQSRNPSLFGRVGTSHASRESLINHLLNEGIHRGKWQVADLHLMSDDSLNDAHNNDHGW